jgi:hypothetical protein
MRIRASLDYRFSRRLRIIACWAKGGHIYSADEWGYGYTGTIDLYCDRCSVRFDTVPLEDFEDMDGVLSLIAVRP